MGKIQSNISLADAELTPVSKETGFSSTPFEFSSTTTDTIWQAIDLAGTYGTVVIIGDIIAGSTNIAVNALNTTALAEGQTFSVSTDPLSSVVINYTSNAGLTSRVSVSISASKFDY